MVRRIITEMKSVHRGKAIMPAKKVNGKGIGVFSMLMT